MRKSLLITVVLCSFLLLAECGKKACCLPPDAGNKLFYGDSVLYLRNADYTVQPLNAKAGTYSAFPDNLAIDPATGAITVTQKGKDGESQTGMWYRVRYRSAAGELDSTMILISGITYVDNFYNLAQNDSIIYPIYNGDPAKAVPAGNYDLTGDEKFAINPVNGQINAKECMRRGFFRTSGQTTNTSWKIATIKYAVNDKSQNVTNKIDVVLYYYHTMADVPSNVSALMQKHREMTVGLRALPAIPSTTGDVDNNLPSDLSLSKPRPPCVIIVGN